MTYIKLFGVKDAYIVKEGYQTVKRRVFTGDLFVEVTIDGRKGCLNKTNIEEFVEEPKKTVVSNKEQKVVNKLKKLSN